MVPFRLNSWRQGCNSTSRCAAPSKGNNSTCPTLPSPSLPNYRHGPLCVPTASGQGIRLIFVSHLAEKWKVYPCRTVTILDTFHLLFSHDSLSYMCRNPHDAL